ncbi:MAG: methylated-DNA--[protein]-cysteine S-methyltransferase [Terrimesophilobacter sp.]
MTRTEGEDLLELLAPLARADELTLALLHSRLEQTAQRDGILDVAFDIRDTPVGGLLLAATEAGLVRVAYAGEDHDGVLATLAAAVSPRILRAPHRVEGAARQIDEYFAGTRTHFDIPLDFRLSHGFRRDVLSHLTGIAYGQTESYAQVARAVGSPRAVRAVGSACATNPLPVIVPCHRVVRSDGTVGGYVGGPEAKRILLTLESAA